jgi:hypothetical protein
MRAAALRLFTTKDTKGTKALRPSREAGVQPGAGYIFAYAGITVALVSLVLGV